MSEEGDMAQADEMGEGDGRDDGFVEGMDPISRRRNKKRASKYALAMSGVTGLLLKNAWHFVYIITI